MAPSLLFVVGASGAGKTAALVELRRRAQADALGLHVIDTEGNTVAKVSDELADLVAVLEGNERGV